MRLKSLPQEQGQGLLVQSSSRNHYGKQLEGIARKGMFNRYADAVPKGVKVYGIGAAFYKKSCQVKGKYISR